jgi:hypothetical protein
VPVITRSAGIPESLGSNKSCWYYATAERRAATEWVQERTEGLLFGGALGRLWQVAHFTRHHRESSSVFTSAGCLDGGIQSQQIALLADLLNHADHFDLFLQNALHSGTTDAPGCKGQTESIFLGRFVSLCRGALE